VGFFPIYPITEPLLNKWRGFLRIDDALLVTKTNEVKAPKEIIVVYQHAQ